MNQTDRWARYAAAMDAVTGGTAPAKLVDAVIAVADAELMQAQAEAHQYRTALQGVARRAAVVSLSTDQAAEERDRYRTAWRSARERAQAYGEGILRHVADRDFWKAEARRLAVEAHDTGTGPDRCSGCRYVPCGDCAAPEQRPSDEDGVEAHRLALSEALHLGTGAPWDAIRDRAGDLSRRDVEAQQQPDTEAQPPYHRWYTEQLDPVANEWAPGWRFTDRAEAVERYRILSEHGTPAERRLVRETTTYTVEEPAPVAQQPDEDHVADSRKVMPLVHVGWWCWRGDNHGHLATMACRSDNVPIHVPAEWADEMRAVIQRIEDGDDEPAPVAQQAAAVPAADLIEDYLKFLRDQGPEPDLSDLPADQREAITGQFEIVKALADRDAELPPLAQDPVARRLGLQAPEQQPAAADTVDRIAEALDRCQHGDYAAAADGWVDTTSPVTPVGPWKPAAADGEEPWFGMDGCTCRPWTSEGGKRRFMEPGETVDRVSGWHVLATCPHHAPRP